MHTFFEILKDFGRFFNPRTRRGLFACMFVVVAVLVLFRFFESADVIDETSSTNEVAVSVASARSFAGDNSFEIIGTVEAINQADIKSEVGGRVTNVPVTLGATVSAGTVIASLENSGQYAALLQAEGAYDAALAAAATSEVGVGAAENNLRSAQNNAVTTYKNAYTSVSRSVYTTIDTIFAKPESTIPGVRIDGGTNTSYLNATRVALNTSLPQWRSDTVAAQPTDVLTEYLLSAEQQTNVVLDLIDTIIARLSEDADQYAGTEFAGLRSELLSDRATLTATLSALTSARTTLIAAEDALAQAQIAGGTSESTSANAQIKQALGSLRAAQSNYEKTIIRTPIAGVINVLDVKAGDFISAQSSIASVANNNALEITTYVGEVDKGRISIGQSVLLQGNIPATVSTIAAAINPNTRKYEVKIQTESSDVINGDTVNITVLTNADTTDTSSDSPLMIPITAVKFTASNGSVFVVTAENTLEAIEVDIGRIEGSYVEITSGITADTQIVTDARGLSAGTTVTVISE
jgi:RND family efflux transporter MFP subunit